MRVIGAGDNCRIDSQAKKLFQTFYPRMIAKNFTSALAHCGVGITTADELSVHCGILTVLGDGASRSQSDDSDAQWCGHEGSIHTVFFDSPIMRSA